MKNKHGLFWSLLKGLPGYKEEDKESLKEIFVEQYSNGRTHSLPEMYTKYPAEYSLMIEGMKGISSNKETRYDEERNKMAKRVIAAICSWLDKTKYKFESDKAKVDYVKRIACRAANCSNFNKIPVSRLNAIYQFYNQKNSVKFKGFPELDFVTNPN